MDGVDNVPREAQRLANVVPSEACRPLLPLEAAPDFIPPRDVPRYIPLCANTVYAAIKDGSMPHVRFGRLLFVPKAGLVALAEGAVASPGGGGATSRLARMA